MARLGGAIRSYPLAKPALLNNGWFPDGKALLYDAEPTLPADMDSTEIGALVDGRPFQDELVRLDLKTGKRRILSFGVGAEFSADGKSLAFSSGGECRDREGVYAMRVDGTQRRRLTNDCSDPRYGGSDTLHGTPLADDLLGLGGNDRLFASDPGYVGDTLDGGPGNDVLTGGFRQDTLYGGPGDDVLFGGPSGDALVGGPGHDRLYGQGGRDTIYAVDGQSDRISCGPNAFGKNGRDVVYARQDRRGRLRLRDRAPQLTRGPDVGPERRKHEEQRAEGDRACEDRVRGGDSPVDEHRADDEATRRPAERARRHHGRHHLRAQCLGRPGREDAEDRRVDERHEQPAGKQDRADRLPWQRRDERPERQHDQHHRACREPQGREPVDRLHRQDAARERTDRRRP